MWFIYAVIFHVLLLGSIFVIYFRSPVISGLQPQPPIALEAPAKRLVLFITDGLRAESFFQNNCNNVAHMRQLLEEKGGLMGISHTRVPTETRPGHIALIAGLYEDPSAVTRGWKENPIEFDTIFKRSYKTYAWGAHDVLHIFNKWSQQENDKQLFFDSYDHELDFSGSEKTYELDKWVFERVENFLQRKRMDLQKEEKVIYFLHLLGLDSAGHIYKPQTDSFLENLQFTDAGIYKMYQLFEKLFPDGKTAYLLTSDHGMTNSGSHGASETYETETPFFTWGAGINRTLNNTLKHVKFNAVSQVPLFDLEQAQLCPLMTTLLGLPPPVNNFGILPADFINASQEYIAQAVVCNGYQLLEQYTYLLKEHEEGQLSFLMPEYSSLSWPTINGLKSYIQQNLESQDYATVLNVSNSLMKTALRGISYYQGYYRDFLLVATTLAMLGWLGYLLSLLHAEHFQKTQQLKAKQIDKRMFSNLVMLTVFVSTFCLVQKLPLQIGFYMHLPLAVMFLNLICSPTNLTIGGNSPFRLSYGQIIILLLCIEFLVISFYIRQMISLGFLLFAAWNRRSLVVERMQHFYGAMLLVLILALFPLLPSTVGYTNNKLWLLGVFITYCRPFVIKCRLPLSDKLAAGCCLLNAVCCVYIHNNQQKLPLICQLISWSYIVYVVATLIVKRSSNPKQNLERVIFLLTVLYTLFCTSYESLFILLLITELIYSLESMQPIHHITSTSLNCAPLPKYQLNQCFRLSFLILLYTFFSIFGCGHMASISSFDPNIIRCFLTTFSPFIIMFLVILKFLLPTFIILCCVVSLSTFAELYEEQLFICLLLICNVMDLNFLFLVRNQGSWLEIGMSISHFVIMQVVTLVLVLFTYSCKAVLGKGKTVALKKAENSIARVERIEYIKIK